MTQRVNGNLFVDGSITQAGGSSGVTGSSSQTPNTTASDLNDGGEEFIAELNLIAYPGDGADGNRVYVITLCHTFQRTTGNSHDLIQVYSGPNGNNTDTVVGSMSYSNDFQQVLGTSHYSVLVKPSIGDAVSLSFTKAANHVYAIGSGGSDPNKSVIIIREYAAASYVSGAVSS